MSDPVPRSGEGGGRSRTTSGERRTGGWEIPVATDSGPGYPVRVAVGAVDELPVLLARLAPAHRYALVGDETVLGFHGERVRTLVEDAGRPVGVYAFFPGEASKTRAEWARITDALLRDGVGRDGCVIALGGGVAGDLAGFVAATYMRGIPVVQIPTSLVAMVDSAVGGKTGVDVPGGKNLVGAFHPPRFVVADPALASTLTRAERSQGLAEAVKHGAILDRGYLTWIRERARVLLEGEPRATAALVARSVEIKAGVVARDEKESGLRQILNFGHTLGHAIEAASHYRVSHGNAVSVGMVLEAGLGEALEVTEPGTRALLSEALRAVELPVTLPGALDPDALRTWIARDKKVRGGRPRFVLLRGTGEVDPGEGWAREVDEDVLEAVLREVGGGPV